MSTEIYYFSGTGNSLHMARDIRWTGVLERRGGAWKICQQHMSQANDKKHD